MFLQETEILKREKEAARSTEVALRGPSEAEICAKGQNETDHKRQNFVKIASDEEESIWASKKKKHS